LTNWQRYESERYIDIDRQAFEWAIDENVDIISLSWGFRTETVPEIERVINKAIESGIIVIAAAGNQGSHFDIPFPANMPDVFCIGAARALGRDSEFNPPHDKDFKFSALGEQVLAAYAKHDCNSASLHNEQQARSGSSIAVAVAVGIAANVLEYVTGALDGRFEGREATVAMKKLFITMSAATRKNDYKNLVPWDLFRSDMAANNQRIDEILKSEIGIGQLMTESVPASSQPKYFMVDYPKNEWFYGRDKLLTDLSIKLEETKAYQYNHRVALYGLGGVGKTQTALAYVYAKREFYTSIFWISGVNETTLRSGFQRIAKYAKIVDAEDYVVRVLAWLNEQSSWLLVIDNLDNIRIVDGFLPINDVRKHTLITTRNPNADGIPAEGLEVQVLDQNEATELLLLRAKLPLDSDVHRLEADKIVIELGHLPLAIEQSAAFIRETSSGITEFLTTYNASRVSRQKLHKWVPEGNRVYQNSVATTWQVSFDAVLKEENGHVAAKLLQLLAFLNPDIIMLDFLEAGAEALDDDLKKLVKDKVDLQAALRLLSRFSLIKRLPVAGSISIHRLVQEVILHEFNEDELRDRWTTIAIFILEAFPPEVNEQTRVKCRKYQSQVIVPLVKSPSSKSLALADALGQIGHFLFVDGIFLQAMELTEKERSIRADASGERHPDTLTVMNNLALTYSDLGQNDRALELLLKVLDARKEVLGEQHPDTLVTMNNMAPIYNNLGQNDKALDLQLNILDAMNEAHAKQDPFTLTNMDNLASTYWHLGQNDKALELRLKVLDARKEVLGEQHPDTLMTMNNLILIYNNLGQNDRALELQLKVVDAMKEVLGEKHPSTLTTMNNLALTYNKLRQNDKALELQLNILDAMNEVLGERHPSTLKVMNNLALTYWLFGRNHKALELQLKVLDARREVLGEQHPDTLTTMNHLVLTYNDLGQNDKAQELQLKVLDAMMNKTI